MGSPVSPYFDGRSHRRRDSRNAGHLAGWPFLRNGSRHGGRFGHLGLHSSIRDQPPAELVEDRIHVAIPWRWIRAIEDVILLRWFPPTPIPKEPVNP